ncbi:MAG: rRNA pseudouridine synthase [Peptostreptococcaceae bacterium]|nr:rRNA pseudouridine synthase [Peptostreptococcaceae bacterium]
MRINKYIATAGITSRRKADELVANGNVKVNGVVEKNPGVDIKDSDVVLVNGKAIKPTTKFEYLALNKPVGYVTTVADEKDRYTVMDLITDIDVRVFPVGRLDLNSSGLLLFTNDGDLANKMTHPKHDFEKTYRVLVRGVVSRNKLEKLRSGVDIGGYVTEPARVQLIKSVGKNTLLEIGITEGKNRQIRKMCKGIECPVIELQRIAVGDILLGRLKEGSYRKLKREEIEYLKNI